jgi:hypothetical protein
MNMNILNIYYNYICENKYIYIYTHTHIYVYIYIYIYIYIYEYIKPLP